MAQGLTGEQGVLIPGSNVDHLMLRRDVVEATKSGGFRIIPIKNIDQGIEILTTTPAGRRSRTGQFPQNSVNGKVEAQLRAYAKIRASFGNQKRSSEK